MIERRQQELSILAETLCTASQQANTQQRYTLGVTLGRESLSLFAELQDSHSRARAMLVLANGYYGVRAYAEARPLLEESLNIFCAQDDQRSVASAKSLLAFVVSYYQQHRKALALAEESFEIWSALEDGWEQAEQLYKVAELALRLNEYTYAQQRAERSLALARKVEHRKARAYALYILARVERHENGENAAQSWYEESLAAHRELEDVDGIALILCDLAHQACMQRKLEIAQELCEQSTALFLEGMNRPGLINSLGELSFIALANGKQRWGVRLLATSDALRETIGLTPTSLQGAYRRIAAKTSIPLRWQEFVHSWQEGRGMTPESVFKQREEHPFMSRRQGSRSKSSLTKREREVLYWLAQGLTNRQIAEHLVISTVTVNAHVRSIYTKLGVSSRSAATRCAFEGQLL